MSASDMVVCCSFVPASWSAAKSSTCRRSPTGAPLYILSVSLTVRPQTQNKCSGRSGFPESCLRVDFSRPAGAGHSRSQLCSFRLQSRSTSYSSAFLPSFSPSPSLAAAWSSADSFLAGVASAAPTQATLALHIAPHVEFVLTGRLALRCHRPRLDGLAFFRRHPWSASCACNDWRQSSVR